MRLQCPFSPCLSTQFNPDHQRLWVARPTRSSPSASRRRNLLSQPHYHSRESASISGRATVPGRRVRCPAERSSNSVENMRPRMSRPAPPPTASHPFNPERIAHTQPGVDPPAAPYPDNSHFRASREGTRPTPKATSACRPRALTRHSVGLRVVGWLPGQCSRNFPARRPMVLPLIEERIPLARREKGEGPDSESGAGEGPGQVEPPN